MATLLISSHVEDVSKWQRTVDDDRATRRAHGAVRERLYQGVADPADILVSIEWDGEDRARLYACSDDLQDLLRQSGSSGAHQVWVLADDGAMVSIRS